MTPVSEDSQLKTWNDARLDKIARGSIFITILIIAIVIFFAFFGVKGLTGRIIKIEEALKAIAAGDFTVQSPESNDEIGSTIAGYSCGGFNTPTLAS